jgi:ATP-dependent Lhr-like helicase
MLYAPDSIGIDTKSLVHWLSPRELLADILSSLNATELTRRRFRDIARIAGLIHSGTPGQSKSMRHLQASTSMVFDALKQYDPANLLLWQASDEVLSDQLQIHRLKETLTRMEESRWVHVDLKQWTPFSFPLMVERIRDRIGNESLAQRIRKIQNQLEQGPASESGSLTKSKRNAKKKNMQSRDTNP